MACKGSGVRVPVPPLERGWAYGLFGLTSLTSTLNGVAFSKSISDYYDGSDLDSASVGVASMRDHGHRNGTYSFVN